MSRCTGRACEKRYEQVLNGEYEVSDSHRDHLRCAAEKEMELRVLEEAGIGFSWREPDDGEEEEEIRYDVGKDIPLPASASAFHTTIPTPTNPAKAAHVIQFNSEQELAMADNDNTIGDGPYANSSLSPVKPSEADSRPSKQAKTAPHEEKPNLTPEQQKRLDALKAKRDALLKNSSTLDHQRNVLLLQLHDALPDHLKQEISLKNTVDIAYEPSRISHTQASLPTIDQEDKDTLMKEANAVIKQHIKLLHEYNEIKDVAQGLIGMIAEQRGVRVVDVQGEFGVGSND